MGSHGELDTYVQNWNKQFISEENFVKMLKRYKEVSNHPNSLPSSYPFSLRIDVKIKSHIAFQDLFSKKLGVDTETLDLSLEMLQNETLNRHLLLSQLDSCLSLIQDTI